jgi:hypothetical protein
MPISSSSTTFSGNHTSLSPLIVGSDTSEDELARNEVTPVNRLKHALGQQPDSHEHTTRRSSRTTPSISQRFTAADLTTLHDQVLPTFTGQGMSRGKESATRQSPRPNQSKTLQSAVEVASERMRHKGVLGWCIKRESKSIFVPDSQWTSSKKDGRNSLFCDRLDVFTYQSGNR